MVTPNKGYLTKIAKTLFWTLIKKVIEVKWFETVTFDCFRPKSPLFAVTFYKRQIKGIPLFQYPIWPKIGSHLRGVTTVLSYLNVDILSQAKI